MMTEPSRFNIKICAAVGFVVGLLLFLKDVHSSGEAPQTLRLSVELTEISELGIVFMLLSLITVAWLYILERKGKLVK
ncbi:MAG: hypothetical protein HY966_01410 [Ignavibacteriales bacterium]|nr:hypothetical protein [Ignavibacteriales bacterium]